MSEVRWHPVKHEFVGGEANRLRIIEGQPCSLCETWAHPLVSVDINGSLNRSSCVGIHFTVCSACLEVLKGVAVGTRAVAVEKKT